MIAPLSRRELLYRSGVVELADAFREILTEMRVRVAREVLA